MSFADFTKLYGTTTKAKFWCDYMNGLKGQLHAIDHPKPPNNPSVWSRVATNEVLLFDVLYGDYFKAPGNMKSQILKFKFICIKSKYITADRDTARTNSFLEGWDPDPEVIQLPYNPIHSKIYGDKISRTSRIS